MGCRIEIAGSLASGKTTLCERLEREKFFAVYENFTGNPYIEKAGQDPEQYGLLCQQWFVDNKISMMSAAIAANASVISDFSLLTDRAYIEYYLHDKPDWIAALNSKLDAGLKQVGNPDVILFLTCSDQEQLRRIKDRGRDFEQNLDAAFVASINTLVRKNIDRARTLGIQIIEIDTEKFDFRNEETLKALLQIIRGPSGGCSYKSLTP